ncbi:MAG: hypothetical protein KC910_25705 [Candidatus Eremiobacteraeota bacterium]|nr:hypothetical protein [Candidatus Eremiobacteraeota bacterium]
MSRFLSAAWPWCLFLAGGFFVSQAAAGAPAMGHFLMMVTIVFADLLVLVSGWQRVSRVSGAVALAGLYLPQPGKLCALLGLLLGTLFLLLGRKRLDARLVQQAGRGLLPVTAAFAVAADAADGAQALLASQVYLIVAFLVPVRKGPFREDLLIILAAPGVALAWGQLLATRPLTGIALLPLVAALACAREDFFSTLTRLYRRADQSQARADRFKQAWQQAEGEKGRLAGLIQAANRMAVLQDLPSLRQAFVVSLRELLPQARLQWEDEITDEELTRALVQARNDGKLVPCQAGLALPSSLAGQGLLVSGQLGEEEQRVALMLARILATCLENARLHGQVVDALEETRKSQTQMLAQGRLAAVGRLAAGVAHEMNTPLGAIRLSAEYGQNLGTRKPERLEEIFKGILSAVTRAQQTVRRLNSYARPDQAEQPSSLFCAHEVVEDAMAVLKLRLRENIELETELDPDLQLWGQPLDLYGIVTNLLLNACDALATIEPPRRLRVSLRRQSDRAWLEVQDNGPGIAGEHRQAIFEAFFTTKPIGAGTGLGLYLSHQMAERLGGRLECLEVESGAFFRADLPLAPAKPS